MKTLKIYLNEDGSIRDYTQDFVINQYSFQDSLINVYVPTSILDLRNTNTTIEDEDTGAIIQTINGTDVQMGLIYTNSNGTTRVGDGYLFNFVKSNIIVNNVNYTLFERLMPKEFSLYAGENNYALNVVNVRTISTTLNGETTTESFTTSLITSATYHLYITASANFDTTTEETTDLENLQAQVNGIADDLNLKQDKEDSTINVYTDSTHTTTTQNVVEGLNDLNARVGTNESDIATLKPQVQTNTEDIATLQAQIICDAIYIGTITANTSPDSTTLTNFVISEGYTLTKGDVVIWIEQISGATDKSYKCMYGASGWGWYEIPPIESASNGTKGLVAGTYGVNSYNTLVNIVDGKVIGIYCKKADNTYEEIASITQSLQTSITNMINGTLSIGSANYATYDESEKENVVKTPINDKFTTPSQVSSAIQDYAMPKVFNEVYFFDFDNNTMVDEVEETTSKTIDLSTIGNKTTTFTQSVSIPHKLNRNNTFQVQLYVGATNLVNDTNASFTLRLIDENNNDITLGTSIATIKAATDIQLVNFTGYTWEVPNEIEVSTACHYELDITILNEYSSNGDITLYNGITDALSTYILSLPFGSFELSEAKKGEVFNINATCSYQETELVDETIEKVLYVGISTSEFNPSNYTSSEYVATHIKATYTALAELDADTTIKAIINGVEYTIYSPQCNDMLYGYFKSVQVSKTLLNGTYTYTFEFDSIFNSTNGFYIDIPYSTIVRLTQTEYNTLSTASLLNDKLNYVITDENSFAELAIKSWVDSALATKQDKISDDTYIKYNDTNFIDCITNILDLTDTTNNIIKSGYSCTDGNYPDGSANSGYAFVRCEVKPNTTYTIRGWFYFALINSNGVFTYSTNLGQSQLVNKTFTTGSDTKYVLFNTTPSALNTSMIIDGDTYPNEYCSYGKYYSFKENQVYAKKNEVESLVEKYYVGVGKQYTTFTQCIKALASNTNKKIIYIDEGTYDIFNEIGGSEYALSIASGTSWRDCNDIIPDNTTIIGLGDVIFNFMPMAEQIGNIADDLLSPINVAGNITIENITINADNCSYCIHDETGDSYENSVKNYKNIKCYKYSSGGLGKPQAYASGFYKGVSYNFENCYFQAPVECVSFHDRNLNGGNININNCAFISTSGSNNNYSIRFGNVAYSQKHHKAYINNCYISSRIYVNAENGNETINSYDLQVVGCNNPTISLQDVLTTNIYTPKIYN